MKSIIVGAGIGGIATAIRLSVQYNHQIEVYESNSFAGGKLSQFELGDFRFDAGPSLFTMPHYVDELFKICGENPDDYFSYSRLEDVCNYFWEDGIRFTAKADIDDFGKEVEEVLGVDREVLQEMMKDSATKYDLTGKIFLERPLHQAKQWFKKDVAKAMTQLHKLDIFTSMHKLNQKKLQHPKLVQFFDRFATYNGSNPYRCSGILNIIPHFEHHFGAYFPKGGMISITNSLVELAKRQGVKFHFNSPVKRIIVKNKKAVGIHVNGEEILADRVISNMDIYPTYKKLLPKEKHPERILKSERSSSALIFYWGINDEFPELDLHNILFSDDYKAEFDAISRGRIYDDPTVYINISSKYHASDAPVGSENWFTMINVPYNNGQNWDELIADAKQNIIKKISRILGVDISKKIVCEEILDPRRIESRTSSYAGALYGTSSNDMMAAFRRHANFSRKIKNLYFCGGSVHPGGGIPLALLSGKITASLIQEIP